MRHQSEWSNKWPEHKNIEHKRCVQDNGFINWVERNQMVLIAVIGVVVVTVMTLR